MVNDKLLDKTYNGINFMKFICAILVIVIHTNPFIGISEGLNYFVVNILSRIAVPFYFICSGYFFYSKLNLTDYEVRKYKLSKYIGNLINIYLLWTMIYFLFNFKSYFIEQGYIKGSLIFIRNFLFIGTQFHLWYLVALFTAVLLIIFLYQKYGYKILIVLSIVMYTFLLLIGPYYGIIVNTPIKKIADLCSYILGTPWNSFFMGFPFIVVGMSIKRYNLNEKISRLLLFSIISFIGYSIEVIIISKLNISRTSSISILLLILTASIFIYIINLENKIVKINLITKYSNIFKELSLLIYLVHGLFLVILPPIYTMIGISNLEFLSMINFILVTVCSILLSLYIIGSKNKVIQFIRRPKIITNNSFKDKSIVNKI